MHSLEEAAPFASEENFHPGAADFGL